VIFPLKFDHWGAEAVRPCDPAWDDPQMLSDVVVEAAGAWQLRDCVASLLNPEVPVCEGGPAVRRTTASNEHLQQMLSSPAPPNRLGRPRACEPDIRPVIVILGGLVDGRE